MAFTCVLTLYSTAYFCYFSSSLQFLPKKNYAQNLTVHIYIYSYMYILNISLNALYLTTAKTCRVVSRRRVTIQVEYVLIAFTCHKVVRESHCFSCYTFCYSETVTDPDWSRTTSFMTSSNCQTRSSSMTSLKRKSRDARMRTRTIMQTGVWQLRPKVVQTVQQHVSYELSGYVEHVITLCAALGTGCRLYWLQCLQL